MGEIGFEELHDVDWQRIEELQRVEWLRIEELYDIDMLQIEVRIGSVYTMN